MRVALYLRVSTDKQSTENQRAPLEQLAQARGWESVLYEETGSAVKARPVFERMLADARAGRAQAVAVVALDRLGRSMAGIIATVRELDRVGCTVVSLRESWLDTGGPARELLLAVFGWVAQEERRILVERTRAGLERARSQGKRLGRPPASPVMLRAAADLVATGVPVAAAARRKGVHRTSLRRYLAQIAVSGTLAESST